MPPVDVDGQKASAPVVVNGGVFVVGLYAYVHAVVFGTGGISGATGFGEIT
jgi:hypothetical protein